MELKGEWWTAPADGDAGGLVMVTGRSDVEKFRSNPRFKTRVEVSWPYAEAGMPSDADAAMMEEATERLAGEFDRDPVAVLTGIYTGDGRRDWVFYTASLHIFCRKLNEALEPLPTLPLEIAAFSDQAWEEYDEMSALEVR